ncbi:hypothetical protein EVAR_56745_1 [Eumeta japonica]|uniref:Gustatory receptor n=1 Tax=Eumeta variegata TaxID=151549 RepID=A0A4C1ZUY6_EUMVA|nr:hypothetical protein EVAR_56745_1 [Eumeta japonica]
MSRSNERLLNNALNADFQHMLRPYYFTQKLLCASKYSIKDSFVLPNSRAYCAVSVLALGFITYFYVISSPSEIYLEMSIMYILTVAWIFENFVMIIMFSLGCERFYSCLDDIRNKCTIAYDLSPERNISRKTAKNILRLCDVRFSKMRPCGLFVVDAALPLRLLGLVATYCIVLLQFAFL